MGMLCRVIEPFTANSPQINRSTDSQYENKGMKNGLYQYMYFIAMFLLYRCVVVQTWCYDWRCGEGDKRSAWVDVNHGL